MELQNGVCGEQAPFRSLRDAVVDRGIAAAAARLMSAARTSGALVVHCNFTLRPDRVGTNMDLPLMRVAQHDPEYLLQGTTAAEVLSPLGPLDGDLVHERHHGVSPFGATTLDNTLRGRGIATVIVIGVSLNIGVLGTAIEAVNHGYDVVIATDAVVGVPVDFGDTVLDNALGALARLETVDEIAARLELAP